MRSGLRTITAIVAAAVTGPAFAADFPSKPITVIVPFAAGGQGDVNARLITSRMEAMDLFDQPFVISNVPGGAATVGMRQAKDAAPDGHTLLYMHQTMMTSELMGTLDFSYTDMVPVAETNKTCLVLATAEGSGLTSAEQWIEEAKANPNGVKEATLVGSIVHFTTAMMAKAADIQVGYVNAGGGAERVASLLGNHTSTGIVVAAPVANNPKLNGLLYYGEERHPLLPDVPTAVELGYDVVSCLDNVWYAPAGTPDDVVEQLATAFETVMNDPDMQASMKEKDEEVAFYRGDALKVRLAGIYDSLSAVAGDLR